MLLMVFITKGTILYKLSHILKLYLYSMLILVIQEHNKYIYMYPQKTNLITVESKMTMIYIQTIYFRSAFLY